MVWNQTAILMVKKSPGTLNNHSWMATFQLDGSKSLLGILFHQTSIHKKTACWEYDPTIWCSTRNFSMCFLKQNHLAASWLLCTCLYYKQQGQRKKVRSDGGWWFRNAANQLIWIYQVLDPRWLLGVFEASTAGEPSHDLRRFQINFLPYVHNPELQAISVTGPVEF